MAKTLNDVLKGTIKAKTEKVSTGTDPGVDYAPKSPDEQKFIAKHTVTKRDWTGRSDDAVFDGSNVKRKSNREATKGYDKGEDKSAYGIQREERLDEIHPFQKFRTPRAGTNDDMHMLRRGGAGQQNRIDTEAVDKIHSMNHDPGRFAAKSALKDAKASGIKVGPEHYAAAKGVSAGLNKRGNVANATEVTGRIHRVVSQHDADLHQSDAETQAKAKAVIGQSKKAEGHAKAEDKYKQSYIAPEKSITSKIDHTGLRRAGWNPENQSAHEFKQQNTASPGALQAQKKTLDVKKGILPKKSVSESIDYTKLESSSLDRAKAELMAIANKVMHIILCGSDHLHQDYNHSSKISDARRAINDIHDHMCFSGNERKYKEMEEDDSNNPGNTLPGRSDVNNLGGVNS